MPIDIASAECAASTQITPIPRYSALCGLLVEMKRKTVDLTAASVSSFGRPMTPFVQGTVQGTIERRDT